MLNNLTATKAEIGYRQQALRSAWGPFRSTRPGEVRTRSHRVVRALHTVRPHVG